VFIVDAKKLYNGKVEIYSSINSNFAKVLVKLKKPGTYNLGKASCKSIITVETGKVIVNGVGLDKDQKMTIQKGERIDVQTAIYSEYKMETDQYGLK